MISVKVMSVVTAGALFLGSMTASAFADSQIFGNGAVSNNAIRNTQRNTADINQTNNSRFNNNVDVRGNTGNNTASFNTGGNTSINTGDVSATVDISNVAGRNVANLNGLNCGCLRTTDGAVISGNGAFSRNSVSNNLNNSLRVGQNNNTDINNRVNVNGNTGGNSSNFNTWGGSSIDTGSVNADVMLHNVAGSNQLGF